MKEQNKQASQFLKTDGGKTKSNAIEVPSINLPKGGGAMKGIDEKFSVNAVNGTASFAMPLPVSKARGVTPSLSLSYNSGAGNSVFGLGWNVGMSSIKRKTDKGLPQYLDGIDSDVFLFSEAEDLVPAFKKENNGAFSKDANGDYVRHEKDSPDGLFTIRFYLPRIEGLFARIERWTEKNTGVIKWRVITKDNITTLFGWSDKAVLANPEKLTEIYEWLPEFVFDDKGNCCHYIYKKEDASGFDNSFLHHANRKKNGQLTYTNLYLEKILYGNKTAYKKFGDLFPQAADYLFETLFDYGEYDQNSPYSKIKNWDFRPDAFSDYKAGFEIRTTRLCKRVLLFHHFKEANEYDGLVSSINLEYDTNTEQDFTFLKSITSFGYIKKGDGTYTSKNLPATEFLYQQHDWSKEVKTIALDQLAHAPSGLDEQNYQFTDLYNEGLAGILTEQANAWYYKHNLGDGKFEQASLVSSKPSFSGLGNKMQLTDLNADGGKQFVSLSSEPKGFFEMDENSEWQPFQAFKNLPNIPFGDPNVRMLDLNGDGKAEVVISEDNVFTWYESEGRKGYSEAHKTLKSNDEEAGAHLVFSDPTQTIFLADMSGDGLTDLVRIRNGEVCYWPNLGFGKFGAKINMDDAPLFDYQDAFNPAFLRLADIDGSGTSDIIYLGENKFTCWKNLSGNRFGVETFEIDAFPQIDNRAKITVTDLLGNGVACIVWSSSLAKDSGAPLKYIDLMNSKKPHIMVFYKNNMGKEVTLEYTPSTKFYIEDKLAGTPWITKLHFPVHCITKSEVHDKISGYRFASTYKYHHGYFDHPEREFRGFGMVEQTDSEYFKHPEKDNAFHIIDQELDQEPVVSKSWFHTGAFLSREKILSQFAHETWYERMKQKGYNVVHHEIPLADARIVPAPGIPAAVIDQLTAEEWQQALRTCKGMPLRSEIFALDAPPNPSADQIKKELTPFSVSASNCVIELLQPKGKNQHAVFVVKQSENISYSYERQSDDPRISHQLNIKLDLYGNVLESASVVYPRIKVDALLPIETQQEQNKTVIIYTRNKFTNDVVSDDVYRLRLPSETKTVELKGVSKANSFYKVSDFESILENSDEVFYHQIDTNPAVNHSQKRVIEHARTNYLRNDLTGALALHVLESHALPYESYQLAYTPELLADIFGPINQLNSKVTDAVLELGKFSHSIDENNLPDSNWWIRSGTVQFKSGGESLATVQNRFFAPVSFTDPFGATTKIGYHGNYFLFVKETEDALGNRSSVDLFNFRTMSPQRMRDINNNLSEAIVDELGLVKATAVFGKGSEADELAGFTEFTTNADITEVESFFNAADSQQLTAKGKALLKNATARFLYDFDVYKNTGKPIVTASIVREQHFQENNDSHVQMSFEYSNGMGKVALKKVQAEPGWAKKVTLLANNAYSVTNEDTSALVPKQLRWIGNGKTILNNKGNAVKQYEPYFSVSHKYEDFKELVETGVTSVMNYDAMGRLVKTDMPDGTFSKVEFDSWKQKLFDANDTVTDSEWYAKRMAIGSDPREKQAAIAAAKHNNTPIALHFDSLGRPILSIEHNKNMQTDADEFYRTKIKLDTEGNLRKVFDARELPENNQKGNQVMEYKYDMLGNLVYQNSMDAGQRWLLVDILGKPLRTWDERNHEFRYFYDILHRPTQSVILGGDSGPALNHIFDRVIYGESLLTANRANEAVLQAINIIGKPIKQYDTGGVVLTPEYDFKDQPKTVTRKLFKDYKGVANWTGLNLAPDLEPGPGFTFTTQTDALGRIISQTAPDGSVIAAQYNEAGLLNSETVRHLGDAQATPYILDIDYNEKGQRNKIIYGNEVSTKFYYDEQTFRLTRLETKRKNNEALQDWYYTFDAVGNITHIEDKNIPVKFFNNQKTTGLSEYTYDALYRLSKAKGRENDAALNFNGKDNWDDISFMKGHNQGDSMLIRDYTQHYRYDEVGNIEQMLHLANGNNWTRDYTYEKTNNRLQKTEIGDEDYHYTHHPKHGFMTVMPHLEDLAWSFREELVKSIKQKVNPINGTAETTYYQYDGKGQRIRKITENSAAVGVDPTKKEERVYIAGYEWYKKHSGINVNLERTTLSLLDEGHRFVMIETRNNINDGSPVKLVRYQLHNYIGSSSLELEGSANANVISYEEYHPFGTTAYQANSNTIKAAAKRYRYTGMERDEETGFSYHSARYYLPWLGRWLSSDPIGIGDGVNVYAYCKNNPIVKRDSGGLQGMDVNEIGMGLMWQRMGQEMSAIWESMFGGKAYINPAANTVDISGPKGGVGGMVGGAVRAATLRIVPIEDNPTPSSLMGMEMGAAMVPVLDPAARLVSGETVTGLPASRVRALIELALDALPIALELRAAAVEAKIGSIEERVSTTSIRTIEAQELQIQRNALLQERQKLVEVLKQRQLQLEADALKAEREKLANLLHQRELGLDQARGKPHLPETQWSKTEATTATKLEQQTGKRLRRARKDEVGDWVEVKSGRTLDAVGPVPTEHFNASSFTGQISTHLRKQGLSEVVVDLSKLTEAQVKDVRSFLNSLDAASQSRIRVIY